MPRKSQKILELAQISEESAVVELALRGLQPSEIARELEIEPRSVQRHLDSALALVQERLINKAERMLITNIMRAERLLKSASPFALGGFIEMYDDNDGTTKEVYAYPDRHWGKLYLDIIKTENEMAQRILKARAPEDDKKGGNTYIENMQVTIPTTGDMFNHAQREMSDDYLSEYLDMDAEDLIEAEIIEDKDEMEKRISDLDKTMRKLLPEGDGEDDE